MNASLVSSSSNNADIVCTIWNTIPIPDNATASNWLYTEIDKVVLTYLIPTIIIVGILGNAAFLFMIARLNRMRTVTNFYLVNLAVADIMIVMCAPSMYLWAYFASPIVGYMPVDGVAGCFTFISVAYTVYYASINVVTLVSLERWLAICRPLQHRYIRGTTRTAKSIIIAWCLALTIALLDAPEFGKSIWFCLDWPDTDQYSDVPIHLHTCVAIDERFQHHPQILEILIYLIALMINGTFYVMIIHKLSNRSVGEVVNPAEDQTTSVRNQVARLLIINGTVFFMCHTPKQIGGLNDMLKYNFGVEFLTKSQYDSIMFLGRAFQFMNSSINVFIYAFSGSFYRNGFRDAFCPCQLPKQRPRGMTKDSALTVKSTL